MRKYSDRFLSFCILVGVGTIITACSSQSRSVLDNPYFVGDACIYEEGKKQQEYREKPKTRMKVEAGLVTGTQECLEFSGLTNEDWEIDWVKGRCQRHISKKYGKGVYGLGDCTVIYIDDELAPGIAEKRRQQMAYHSSEVRKRAKLEREWQERQERKKREEGNNSELMSAILVGAMSGMEAGATGEDGMSVLARNLGADTKSTDDSESKSDTKSKSKNTKTSAVPKQYASNQSYCLQEVKDTNGFTSTIRNTCSQDLEVTFCWGVGLYCRTHTKATKVPAGRDISISKSDEASERLYSLISFAAPTDAKGGYSAYLNGAQRYFEGKKCTGSGCLGY